MICGGSFGWSWIENKKWKKIFFFNDFFVGCPCRIYLSSSVLLTSVPNQSFKELTNEMIPNGINSIKTSFYNRTHEKVNKWMDENELKIERVKKVRKEWKHRFVLMISTICSHVSFYFFCRWVLNKRKTIPMFTFLLKASSEFPLFFFPVFLCYDYFFSRSGFHLYFNYCMLCVLSFGHQANKRANFVVFFFSPISVFRFSFSLVHKWKTHKYNTNVPKSIFIKYWKLIVKYKLPTMTFMLFSIPFRFIFFGSINRYGFADKSSHLLQDDIIFHVFFFFLFLIFFYTVVAENVHRHAHDWIFSRDKCHTGKI